MPLKKDDSFFQLSLTELAFVLIFVVLLLIGAKVVLIGGDVSSCQSSLKTCEQRANTCEIEKNSCLEAIAKGGKDPNTVIDTLVNAPKLKKENAELKEKEKRLEEKLKAFEEIKKTIPDPVRMKTAEKFLEGYEKASQTSLPMSDAAKLGEQAAALEKELANCRGQLKHCVKVTGATKGYGLPPCWTDTEGRIQYLFGIEIRPDGLSVERAWPDSRSDDARQLSGLQETLDSGMQTLDKFKANTQNIFEISKKSNPECRHYVVIRKSSSLKDIDQFNRIRLGIEDYFYKLDRTGASSR